MNIWRLRDHSIRRGGRAGRHRYVARRRGRVAIATLSSGLLAVAVTQLVTMPAGAAPSTLVSLTFDGDSISQYTLGYQQALQPHSAAATFFVNSGTVAASGNFMTWTQLSTLASAGEDIGGKTVNATNLNTDPNPSTQICNDRTTLLQHGLQPVAFAYPGGATSTTVQGLVSACGYGNARTAGSLSPTGPTYAETLPPRNWLATRAYAPSGQVTLANMQALVSGAAANNGGWSQIVIGKVCSQTLDPTNYTTCKASAGWIELADLNAFLDWMGNAGLSGGAPAGASLSTVRAAVGSADTSAPTTTISCNGAACADTPYDGVVTVALAATDVGSSVAATRFTVDGTDPTDSSSSYTGPFSINGASSTITVKYRSWDYAGNVEPVRTQVIQAPPDTAAPTTTISCNQTTCGTDPYVASVTVSMAASDAGGSGLSATYYTTDGSTPTTASPVYTAPFPLDTPGTYQIKFFSTDRVGNAEQVQTQQIKVVPVKTEVSLTFDNGTVGQYTLGYQQALQPHGANATFFVNSGTIGKSANTMTWAQLSALAAAGDDIGGKTVNATNLTTDPDPTGQICDDRSALRGHGLDPVAFAYPGGALNATLEGIVHSCGYGSGRSAGSLSPNGPTYAEPLTPKDWYATRAYAPSGQMTLANMQALVTGASAHGGGWSQLVIGRVCSQSQDPGNYTSCTASAGWIELTDLNAFLDWMASAGQPGGAPAGAALATVRAAAIAADTIAPITTIACNGVPCASDTYTSTVYVTLPSTDVGSAVASTHYTTDGSDPTLSSPTYTARIPITSTTTLKYRSWDNAGNAEATNTQLINADLPPDSTPPVTAIACDGNPCTTDGYNGKTTVALTATDTGGWGVDNTYYTLDGSTPDTTSTVYTAPITLDTPGRYTVQFFSTDLAGNIEQVQSQQLTVLPPKVIVSLTFDDGDVSQYALAYQHALEQHHMAGTFFVNTGNIASGPGFMTWADLSALSAGGSEVAGHTVHHIDLTSSDYTQQQKIDEVCNDRQALIDHGFYPTSFAYPFGSYDANAESIVQGCGYTSARRTGGIPFSGAPYAEAVPPKDPYATITWTAPTPTTSPIQLSDMQAAVTAAASHGGGWVQFVAHQVCSQTYDPASYSTCLGSFRPTELDTFNQFLDWLQTSGQPGGAPPRTEVETVSQVVDGPDLQQPISALDCDNSPCQSSTYTGSTTISLASKDPGGSGVAATYYTTDGTTPTTSSPKFVLPFTINQTTTISFFSVDNSGNVEPVQTQTVTVVPNTDPVIGAAGDIACDPDFPAFNDGLGTATDCRAAHTADLLNGVDAVLPLGDVQYQCSGPAAYAQAYNPTWGVKKSITHPVPGGEDYLTSGGTDCQSTPGAGYYQYFGDAAGDPTKGYYSYNLGQWHVVAINTAPCEDGNTAWCAAGSQMDQWLQQDLAANHSSCTLAYYQNPRFNSAASGSGGDSTYQQIWADLYNGGVDVALNGDSHWYERFAPLDASGSVNNAHGVREFIVGTGGAGLDTPGAEVATSQVLNNTTHGVIRMTLHSGSYDWVFVPDEGTFTDSGTAPCHGKPDQTAPTTTAACNGAACTSGWYQSTVQVSLTAIDNTGGSGVDKTYYTTDGSTPTTSSIVYTAPFPIASTSTVKFFSVDKSGNAEPVNSQSVQVDPTPPTTLATCNLQSCSGTYTSNVQLSLTATDAGGSGVVNTFYTTDGTTPTTASSVYSGPLDLATTTTVKYFSVDAAGNAESVNTQVVTIDNGAPTTTIQCNSTVCSSGFYAGTVQVSLVATDAGGSGGTTTYYTTDGTTPTTSSIQYSGPFPIGVTATVRFFSVDAAGNSETPQAQQIRVDSSAPTTTATCNSQSCGNWFTVNVSVNLTATDTGGSGLSKIFYTTNGSTPTTASAVFTAPFTVTAPTTVKFFAMDNAGNSEAVKTVAVQIDKTAPTTTIRCNNGGCGTAFSNSVNVTLAATDDTGGSGVSSTHYTTDGTTPSLSSPVYSGPFTLTSSTTLRYRSWDVAGNVEAARSQSITVRVDAPPVPALKLTPASGLPPLAVTADASGSTDTDATGIKNYSYDWGDGSVAQTTTKSTASHTYATIGTFTVTLTVTDTAGLSATTTAQVVVQPNLVGNPGFESNTNGWATGDSLVSLTRTTGQHHSGSAAAQISNTSSASRACKLTDSPPWMGATVAGTYTASLWVKAPNATAGSTVTLSLVEMSGSSVVGAASTPIKLSTSWQQVKVSYTIRQPGATALDFTASVPSVPRATIAFYADDAALFRS